MMKICFNCLLLLVYLVTTVHARSRHKVPVSPVGPFDEAKDDYFSTPPKPAPHPVEGGLFQGDIQIAGKRIGNAGTTRVPWPNGVIPYRFDCSVVNIASAVKATKEAMKDWEANTCIRFVEKRPEDKAFLELFRAAGCWATYVGYRKDTKTQISIGNGCDYKHVMVHELGHVIGFWHEQSRTDRDKYIRINFGNVVSALRYNFDIVREQTNSYGEAYDYASIMHYPWNAFAINRARDTIIPLRPDPNKTPYVQLSVSDAAQTKKMYKCSGIEAGRATSHEDMNKWVSSVGKSVSPVSTCKDFHDNCPNWANSGECDIQPDPMLSMCRKSCDNCGPCVDNNTNCEGWAFYGFCAGLPFYMLKNCKKSCHICQAVEPAKPPTTIPTRKPTRKQTPRKQTTRKQTTTKSVRKPTKKFTGARCVDRSEYCQEWRKDGRCKTDRWVKDNCLLSCERYDICDAEPIKPVGTCVSPLGIGWDNKLPNNNFFATSIFVPGGGWTTRFYTGRLYLEDNHSKREIGAWCALPGSGDNHYLEIDLSERKTITAVATQGRDHYFEHTKTYSLSFSRDRRNWKKYEENGELKIFDGNCDHFTPVMNILENRQVARYIRFYPLKYSGAKCLRVEVYGCRS